ncbi:MAG: peptide/nickel transport system substrate-binding protein [Actinomycetota bacterium]|nr:peptide/nickel transport system substrate-binding protein [Actinomycetota bacterium]
MTSRSRSSSSPFRLLLLILALVSLVAAACGGGGSKKNADTGIVKDTTVDEGTPVDGGSVTFGLEAESTGWQPCVDSHSESGTTIMHALYDPLTARAADGKVVPYLAESLAPNADLTEWTMKMRPGVKFQDGTALDSAAVKANFDAAKAPTSRCAGALATVDSMEVVDPLTVKYKLKSPYGPFAELLTGAPGYIFSPTNAAKFGADVSAHPVGTGPFVFDSWERDSKLTVKKNPTYWQKGLPHLDQVIFKPIPDEDARLASLSSGEVDMMFTLRQQDVQAARDLGDAVKRYEFIGNNSGSSIFNVKKAPVDDKRVRKAFAYAQDQDALVSVLGGKGISPTSTQFFSKDSPWYSKKVADAYPQNNPTEAKKLLDAYKNDPARSDGKKPGDPVSITFACPPDATLIAYAQAVQQMETQVGFQVELKQVEQATHIQNAVGKAPYTEADYMINCWRLGGQGDPDNVLFNQYAPPNGQAANVTNFDNPEVQALLKTARESADFKTRYDAYEKIGLIFDEEVPQTWTGSTAASTAAKPNVHQVAGPWTYPDGKSKGKSEQSVVAFAYVWVSK